MTMIAPRTAFQVQDSQRAVVNKFFDIEFNTKNKNDLRSLLSEQFSSVTMWTLNGDSTKELKCKKADVYVGFIEKNFWTNTATKIEEVVDFDKPHFGATVTSNQTDCFGVNCSIRTVYQFDFDENCKISNLIEDVNVTVKP